MPRYQFPNVPQAPGVPQMTRSPAFPNTTPPLLGTALALGRLVLALTRSSGWGIFRDFSNEDTADRKRNDQRRAEGLPPILNIVGDRELPVLVPDSFLDFGFRQEWSVTTAPTENGGFATYNKVNNPFETQVRVMVAGSLRKRTEFLQKLQEIAGDLRLYRIVTPEQAYLGCNISRYEITRKKESGAYLLSEIDIFFTEIRSVVSEYTNTTFNTGDAKQASAESIKNSGTVAAAASSGSITGAIAAAVARLAP